MTRISIIMPAYNVEKYIGEAIDSITNNGFKRYELIIVDDSSTDNTLKIAVDRAKENINIKVISTEGGNGCSYGRKIGLNIAKGKYIYFCDADDYLEKGLLEFLYNESEKYNLDVLMFNGRFKNELDNEWGITHDKLPIVCQDIPSKIVNGQQLLEIMKNNREWRYAVWLYFVKKDIIDNNVDFFRGIVHEDPPYNYQLLNSSKRVKYYNICGYNYRLRNNSLMSIGATIKDIEGYINAYNLIYDYNDINFSNDESKMFYEIRMLEQLEESFMDLTSPIEIKAASTLIKEIFKRIDLRNYSSLEIVEKLKKEVQDYETI